MTNLEASEVIREWIRVNSPCNGLELALQKAITALEHAPDTLHDEAPTTQQCNACGRIGPIHHHICACGSTDLRPIYDDVSEIGRKA